MQTQGYVGNIDIMGRQMLELSFWKCNNLLDFSLIIFGAPIFLNSTELKESKDIIFSAISGRMPKFHESEENFTILL